MNNVIPKAAMEDNMFWNDRIIEAIVRMQESCIQYKWLHNRMAAKCDERNTILTNAVTIIGILAGIALLVNTVARFMNVWVELGIAVASLLGTGLARYHSQANYELRGVLQKHAAGNWGNLYIDIQNQMSLEFHMRQKGPDYLQWVSTSYNNLTQNSPKIDGWAVKKYNEHLNKRIPSILSIADADGLRNGISNSFEEEENIGFGNYRMSAWNEDNRETDDRETSNTEEYSDDVVSIHSNPETYHRSHDDDKDDNNSHSSDDSSDSSNGSDHNTNTLSDYSNKSRHDSVDSLSSEIDESNGSSPNSKTSNVSSSIISDSTFSPKSHNIQLIDTSKFINVRNNNMNNIVNNMKHSRSNNSQNEVINRGKNKGDKNKSPHKSPHKSLNKSTSNDIPFDPSFMVMKRHPSDLIYYDNTNNHSGKDTWHKNKTASNSTNNSANNSLRPVNNSLRTANNSVRTRSKSTQESPPHNMMYNDAYQRYHTPSPNNSPSKDSSPNKFKMTMNDLFSKSSNHNSFIPSNATYYNTTKQRHEISRWEV